MGKRERRKFTDDFKREAVPLTETSGRTIMQVADDLGDPTVQSDALEEAMPGNRSPGRPA